MLEFQGDKLVISFIKLTFAAQNKRSVSIHSKLIKKGTTANFLGKHYITQAVNKTYRPQSA